MKKFCIKLTVVVIGLWSDRNLPEGAFDWLAADVAGVEREFGCHDGDGDDGGRLQSVKGKSSSR